MSDSFGGGEAASEERAGAFRGGLSFGEDISHSFKLIACGQLLLSRAL